MRDWSTISTFYIRFERLRSLKRDVLQVLKLANRNLVRQVISSRTCNSRVELTLKVVFKETVSNRLAPRQRNSLLMLLWMQQLPWDWLLERMRSTLQVQLWEPRLALCLPLPLHRAAHPVARNVRLINSRMFFQTSFESFFATRPAVILQKSSNHRRITNSQNLFQINLLYKKFMILMNFVQKMKTHQSVLSSLHFVNGKSPFKIYRYHCRFEQLPE